jgi:kynurenine formamidase
MTRTARGMVGLLSVAAVAAGAYGLQGARLSAQQKASERNGVTKAEYEKWTRGEQTSLPSNWGRWGKDDEIGTLNLITPAKRKQAAALVKEGVSISLARDADFEKAIDNPNPYAIQRQLGSDTITVGYHGWAHTHLDALSHHFDFGGQGYNGYRPDEELVKKSGHPKNSILNVKGGIFTRGVLLDIPRLKNVPYLEPGTPIYIEDLEAAAKAQGITLASGDALFIRTGVWPYRQKFGPYVRGRRGKDAGLDVSVLRWPMLRDISLMGSDHPQGVNPAEIPNAVHDFSMVGLGIHLIDDCDLEALAQAAASRRRWEFLVTVAPLPVGGGTGSPANPIATF